MVSPRASKRRNSSQVAHCGTRLAFAIRIRGAHSWVRKTPTGLPDHDWENYLAQIDRGVLPIFRGMKPTGEERLIRELILQMKRGRVSLGYFRNKFGVNVWEHFAAPLGT